MSRAIVFGAVLSLCTPLGAHAQGAVPSAPAPEDDVRLAPITVTGLRPADAGDITASVSIIDAAALAVRDAPYIADQLRVVPGLAVSRSGAVGGLTQLRIRGAEANHTLVLIDGIEVSDPTTGETDLGLLPGLTAGRIEVVRGEQSVLYGSDAVGGVVNIQPLNRDGLSARAEAGSRDTVLGVLGYGFSGEPGSARLAMSGTSTEGVDTSGQGGEEDGASAFGGLATGSLSLDANGAWTLSGLLRYAQGEVETDPDLNFDGQLDNADRVTETDQTTLGTALSGATGAVDHVVRASFNTISRDNLADGSQTDSTEGERLKLSYSPGISGALADGEWSAAALIDWEQEDYTRTGEASFFGDPNQSVSFETTGIAGEVRARFGALSANASARVDDNDGRFDDATTWRLGAAYAVLPSARVRFSAGTGVKNPTFVELFGFFPGSFVGNPDLKPEQSTSWEIGWDQTIGAFTGSLTWFQAELEDEVVTRFNPDFTSSPANLEGDSEREGIEAAAAWRASDALSLSASVSNIRSENDTGEDEIRVPEWTGSVALDWSPELVDGARFGLAADYVGEQDDLNFGSFPAERVTQDAYWLVSATAEYPVTDRFSVTLRGDNLLDETVTDVFGFFGPGAGVYVGVKLR